jgi:hypothetical protein
MVEFEVVFFQEQWSWCFFVMKFQGGRIHYCLKQASAFNVICSTFMLAHLEDPSIKKTLDVSELEKAKQVLLDTCYSECTVHPCTLSLQRDSNHSTRERERERAIDG